MRPSSFRITQRAPRGGELAYTPKILFLLLLLLLLFIYLFLFLLLFKLTPLSLGEHTIY
jgi:hypothetical protein